MALSLISRYTHWLHGRWPAGKPEKLPQVAEDGSTNVPGLYVAGDLSGIPLLKFSLETGTNCVRQIQARAKGAPEGGVDVAIIGGGVAGVAAAVEAKRLGLSYVLLESNQLFATIANFPKAKPIYTYPQEMEPAGELSVSKAVKEELLAELEAQAAEHGIMATPGYAIHVERHGNHLAVHRKEGEPLLAGGVVVAIGRSGNYHRLGVAGEDADHVLNRLHDPAKHVGERVLVVGGGDSACEAAISIAEQNPAESRLVTLSYRGSELSRPKPENVARVLALAQEGRLDLRLGSTVGGIGDGTVTLKAKGQGEQELAADTVLVLIGREAPLDFFRRSGVRIAGEFTPPYLAFLAAFFAFVTLLYATKAFNLFDGWALNPVTAARSAAQTLAAEGGDQGLRYTLLASMGNGIGFYITLLYSTAVVVFGIRRIQRRKTPYVTLQTTTLMLFQCLPLFLLPEILLPWAGHAGAFDDGWAKIVADNLFPAVDYDLNGREYWRAYGFILAWPLFVWNVFTGQPHTWWLAISLVQTFVIIPLIVWRWGKGAYCGWICSCGALAEGMGDQHREKMPHGPFWNRLNLVGQAVLLLAFAMLLLRIVGWTTGSLAALNDFLLLKTWKPGVDFLLAGALGTGLYFAFSGRVWCRFACPLAALMHIYARFSQFRIVVDQKKCISCNACTTVCHQGIDIMNFANKGHHMEDPQCVRCSACVQTCPTGVLQFGRVDGQEQVLALDNLVASPVIAREGADRLS